ncbi:MAG: tetratricopeptide repeat protein [Ignavibacteriales bacterium]|nr:tetratricopeptide repeat protein [Ignavibacteriales bacterium]
MNEMLGNQYFLSRNYPLAQTELERALEQNPSNTSVKKKLVICHIQTGSTERAVDLFLEIITHDIHSIIDTDPLFDNCPCPQLVYEMENSLPSPNTKEKILALGMLWLFCDIRQSLKYFTSVVTPNKKIEKIVTQLQSTIQQLQTTRSE